MKSLSKKLVFFFMTVILCCVSAVSCTAVNLPEAVRSVSAAAEISEPKLTVTGDSINVAVLRSIKLKAEVSGVTSQPEIEWSSSNNNVAAVNKNGKVTGLKVGRAVITATAKVNGKTLEGKYALNVTTAKNIAKSILESNQILSYQYSYVDDFYYANDKECWQDKLGFARIYDLIAPYLVLEYDYTRVFFTYEEQDFMVQFWKGQYGYLFYGSEIGIYSKPADGKEVGMLTFFKKPAEKYWPKMEMTLYHQNLLGNYVREFTRDYDTYWWCTGFKSGHLRVVEPADELRTVNRITLKDAKMAKLFAQGLKDCGFKQVSDKNKVGIDEFYRDGADVYITWQNISEAENTMPIKIAGGALLFFNFLASFIAFLIMSGLFIIIF